MWTHPPYLFVASIVLIASATLLVVCRVGTRRERIIARAADRIYSASNEWMELKSSWALFFFCIITAFQASSVRIP